VALVPKTNLAVSVAIDGEMRVWNIDNGSSVGTYPLKLGELHCVAAGRSGDRVYCGTKSGLVQEVDLATGKLLRRFEGPDHLVYQIATSPDGAYLAAGTDVVAGTMWSLADGHKLGNFEGHAICFSPDSRRMLISRRDFSVHLLTVPDGQELARLSGHGDHPQGLAILPGNRQALSVSWDGTFRQWRLTKPEPPGLAWSTPPGNAWWFCACFSPRGDRIAAGEDPRPNSDLSTITVRVWRVRDGKPDGDPNTVLHKRPKGSIWLTGLTFSGDGTRLASGANDGSICLWNLATAPPTRLCELTGGNDMVAGQAFSPDGRYFAAGARQIGNAVHVWDLSDPTRPTEAPTFTPPDQAGISALVFSTDSRTLYVGTGKPNVGGRVYAWSYQSATPATILWQSSGAVPDQTGPWVRGLDVSRDGVQLGVAWGDQALILNSSDGRLRFALQGHAAGRAVKGISFSADGSRCITAGHDQSVRLWSTRDGKQLWQNDALTGVNEGVGMSPDGRSAFTAGHLNNNPAGNVAQLWRLPDPMADK
jgi:WD40 repeat protein